MEPQISQHLDQQLRQNWNEISPEILRTFTTVSRADVDAARSAEDLVQRIADVSNHSERYVETKVLEAAGVTSGGGGSSQSQPSFGSFSQGQGSQQSR